MTLGAVSDGGPGDAGSGTLWRCRDAAAGLKRSIGSAAGCSCRERRRRSRSLPGLLARTAYEAVRLVLKAMGEGKDAAPRDAAPGFVASSQTFGS